MFRCLGFPVILNPSQHQPRVLSLTDTARYRQRTQSFYLGMQCKHILCRELLVLLWFTRNNAWRLFSKLRSLYTFKTFAFIGSWRNIFISVRYIFLVGLLVTVRLETSMTRNAFGKARDQCAESHQSYTRLFEGEGAYGRKRPCLGSQWISWVNQEKN